MHQEIYYKSAVSSGPCKRRFISLNRTIKEATVKRYHYDNHQQFKSHLTDFVNAYNYGRRLKTLCLTSDLMGQTG